MFDGIKNFLRRIARMFGYTQLKSILGTDVALSQGMIDGHQRMEVNARRSGRLD